MGSRDETSAGGVVYRKVDDQIEVLICKDGGYHKWVLPKGMVNHGETLEQTAVREVREEVGVHARLITSLGEPEKYIYTRRGMRIFKTVQYYLMEYASGSEADHDHEMEDVRWVGIDEAITMVGYQGAKTMLTRAKAILTA